MELAAEEKTWRGGEKKNHINPYRRRSGSLRRTAGTKHGAQREHKVEDPKRNTIRNSDSVCCGFFPESNLSKMPRLGRRAQQRRGKGRIQLGFPENMNRSFKPGTWIHVESYKLRKEHRV